MSTFRALRLVERNFPLIEEHLPTPELKAGEALVRVLAAGICRSDVHYQRGTPKLPPLPRTLGHEIAGIVEALATDADPGIAIGERVGVHYQTSCGTCRQCTAGHDQFCETGQMIGNSRDGGYAELVAVPVRNLVPVPDPVPIEQAAVMMCSSATCLHALDRARLEPGESVAVFGLGGLGQSAVQLAFALGAGAVFAVDTNPAKTALAGDFGATPVVGGAGAVDAIRRASGGVDVAFELVGLGETMRQAIDVLGPHGRAVAVGLADDPVAVQSFSDLVLREAEIIGVSDHVASDLPRLLDIAADGRLDLSRIVTKQVPLSADAVNQALADLGAFGDEVRTVITPGA